jgi:hypothetical protein
MSALTKCWSISSFAAGVFLASTVLAGSGGGDPCSCPQAHRAALSFQAGDTLQTAAEGTKLMLGSEVVATVPKGERIVVLETRGAWIGTRVSVNGQMKAGWIRTTDFAPINRLSGSARGVEATFAANPQLSSQPQASAQPQAGDIGGPAVYEPRSGSSGGYYFGYPTDRHEVYGHYHP